MATKHNLAIVPALKIDDGAPGAPWVGGGDWARTTSAHASLPRTTALAGTTASSPACGRADVVAGKYYVISLSVRAIAPQLGTLNVDWKTAGNTYISTTSGAGSDYGVINMVGSSTQRFAIIGQAPTNAGRAITVASGLDAGGAQVTASMVRQFDTLLEAQTAIEIDRLAGGYFDGDSAGASWDGADGESTSTITSAESAFGTAEFGGLVAFGLGVRESFGAGEATFLPLFAASGLFAQATYDPRRGRIRITANGLAGNVVRVIVYSRPKGTTRWSVVRGGKVAVTAGAMLRRVDDYEYRAGGGMEYRVDGLASLENQPDNIVQVAYAEIGDTDEQVWLKFIPAPHTNLPVELLVDDWELAQTSRSTVHEVSQRPDPVVVTDVHGSVRTVVRFKTYTDEAREELRLALGQGAPAFLQVPASIPFPTMYVSIGDVTARRWGGRFSRKYVTTVQITEVAPPPPSVVGSAATWATLLAQYDTWQDVIDAFDSWLEVMQ